MNAKLQALAARFAAYKPRERALMAGAVVLAVGFVGYSLWVEPARLRSGALGRQMTQQQGETASLEAQLAGLKARLTDPDAASKAALAEAHRQLAATDKELGEFNGILVKPDQVPQLLQSLLGRHRGLSLVSLQSIAPVPLIPAPEKKDKEEKAPPVPAGNIYKHGIEIKVAGSYPDLLAYVAELERAPQKLLWGSMNLSVKTYPRSELTLTVYTLSLDPRWLVV